MKIAVLGTGMVGRAHAIRLVELGNDVTIGTKNVAKTLSVTNPDQMGNPPFSLWHKDHSQIKLMTFADAVKDADLVFEALHGSAVLNVLKPLESFLTGKILIDISNPLDFSKGMPPTLFVANTDSHRICRKLFCMRPHRTRRAVCCASPENSVFRRLPRTAHA